MKKILLAAFLFCTTTLIGASFAEAAPGGAALSLPLHAGVHIEIGTSVGYRRPLPPRFHHTPPPSPRRCYSEVRRTPVGPNANPVPAAHGRNFGEPRH